MVVTLFSMFYMMQSAERVLILEYMDGVRLNDSESLQALGVDKQKLVEEITRAYAHQIYVDGFFNGDPHPGTPSLLNIVYEHYMSDFVLSFTLWDMVGYVYFIYVISWICYCRNVGNFLVSKAPPHRPILLDFGLTKKLSPALKQALAKMFLASAEVCTLSVV